MANTYKAWVVSEKDGKFEPVLSDVEQKDPGDQQVVIAVKASSLNYKDFLSLTGNKGVTKSYPHTPGIDCAGVVARSSSAIWKEGDEVLVTGFDLGMNTDGGFAQQVLVPEQWVVGLPASTRQDDQRFVKAMAWGTAGFTAAQCVEKIVDAGTEKGSPVLVSGATGNVGTIAVALLSHLGYDVSAITREEKDEPWLRSIGAKQVLDLAQWCDDKAKSRPMLRGEYAAGVDTLGGDPLAVMLKSLSYRGVVACCGLVAGASFPASVFPFILRGVTLYGVDSAECPLPIKKKLWKRIETEFALPNIEDLYTTVTLADVPKTLMRMKDGLNTGRIVVEVS